MAELILYNTFKALQGLAPNSDMQTFFSHYK